MTVARYTICCECVLTKPSEDTLDKAKSDDELTRIKLVDTEL